MPYALFSHDAKLSNAYPTEADVWKLARKSGLVVDAASVDGQPAPRPVLDNDYEIRPYRPNPAGGSGQESGRRRARSRAGISIEFFRVGLFGVPLGNPVKPRLAGGERGPRSAHGVLVGLKPFPFRLNRNGALDSRFDAFS
jgi:hypothetical protein